MFVDYENCLLIHYTDINYSDFLNISIKYKLDRLTMIDIIYIAEKQNIQHNIYSNYQNYITNQNKPIMIQCSQPLFIGDLRDFSKIVHLHVRC